MFKTMERLCSRVGGWFTAHSLTRKQLNLCCMVLFILMLIPMVLVAFYNYPADDDFEFALGSATAWVQTGSLLQVGRAIGDKLFSSYHNTHGAFISSLLSFSTTPLTYDMNLYFLSNWAILAVLCLSIAYLVKSVLYSLLSAQRGSFWLIYTPIMILVLQFMPAAGDGLYWHSGGMYLYTFCNICLSLGLLIRVHKPQSKARSLWRGCMLALNGFMIGGSGYPLMLSTLVLLAGLLVILFSCHSKKTGYAILWSSFFVVAATVSLLAPGNQLRQERLGDTVGPLYSVVTAILDGFDLASQWCTPQLLAMLLLIVPAMWPLLQKSTLTFRHPFLWLVLLYGNFAATLVPGIYTQFGYGAGRVYNVIYTSFLLLAIGSTVYAVGWLIRFFERRQAPILLLQWTTRFSALYLALVVGMLTLGGFGYTIMNTSSISATKSLATGEAALFRQAMEERQEYIRVTDSDVVDVHGLPAQPYIFKDDKLPFQGIYGRVRYMKWYFELFYNAQHPEEATPVEGNGTTP